MALTKPTPAMLGSPVSGSVVATTSGTSQDVTGIPTATKLIIVTFNGVSSNGTSPFVLQLGDAGGFETTGYSGEAESQDAATFSGLSGDAGFTVHVNPAAATAYSGFLMLMLADPATFTWVAYGVVTADTQQQRCVSGVKSLSAELTQLRLTTQGGTDTFDAGNFRVMYF